MDTPHDLFAYLPAGGSIAAFGSAVGGVFGHFRRGALGAFLAFPVVVMLIMAVL